MSIKSLATFRTSTRSMCVILYDPSQIRPRTDAVSGKRKRLALSRKLRICLLVLMAVSKINEMKSDGWFRLYRCSRSPALFLGFSPLKCETLSRTTDSLTFCFPWKLSE